MVKKIISGGQTGADQAALDFAIESNIPHGGWIPKGRMTEEGTLPDKYQLQEMPTKSYPQRTEKNVIDSDGTVILTHGTLAGGSSLTRKKALLHDKPFLHLNLSKIESIQAVNTLETFINENNIKVLNVAGSRASKDCSIYAATYEVVKKAIMKQN